MSQLSASRSPGFAGFGAGAGALKATETSGFDDAGRHRCWLYETPNLGGLGVGIGGGLSADSVAGLASVPIDIPIVKHLPPPE